MYIKKTVGYILPLNEVGHQIFRRPPRSFKASPGVYIKKTYGYVVANDTTKGLTDAYYPPTVQSGRWKHWVTILDPKRCYRCRKKQGEIYPIQDEPPELPPLHPNCRCTIQIMKAAIAGTATRDGEEGADYWIYCLGELPDNYITKQEAKDLGWIALLGNLHEVAPWKMIGGNIYKNKEGRLPDISGRIWYEADINYQYGYRNGHRVLYSNDGLIFATYNHFWSFIEIIGEDSNEL